MIDRGMFFRRHRLVVQLNRLQREQDTPDFTLPDFFVIGSQLHGV